MRSSRILPLAALLLTVLATACTSEPPLGAGSVKITETTTSTTTTTIPVATAASFTFSPVTPQELQEVFFNASGSTPGSGRTITKFSWDFGDGTLKTGVTASHDYTPNGVYLITLTVTDDLGKKATSSQTIVVRPAPLVPPTP